MRKLLPLLAVLMLFTTLDLHKTGLSPVRFGMKTANQFRLQLYRLKAILRGYLLMPREILRSMLKPAMYLLFPLLIILQEKYQFQLQELFRLQ